MDKGSLKKHLKKKHKHNQLNSVENKENTNQQVTSELDEPSVCLSENYVNYLANNSANGISNNSEPNSLMRSLNLRDNIDSVRENETKVLVNCNDIKFTCSLCNQQSNSELEFEDHHERVHSFHGDGISTCFQCKDVFKNKQDLFWHLQTSHFEMRTYKCPHCKVITLDKTELELHRKGTHSDDFKCWACDAAFGKEDELIEHFDINHFIKY